MQDNAQYFLDYWGFCSFSNDLTNCTTEILSAMDPYNNYMAIYFNDDKKQIDWDLQWYA